MASGFRVTDRDLEIVGWLGRVKVASIEQIKHRFGMGQTQAYTRLKGLRRVGLVGHEHVLHGGGVFYATGKGLRAAGISLPVVKVRVGNLRHDLAATDAVVVLENRGAKLLTEREIRREHRELGKQLYCTDMQEPGKMHRSKHTPDLVILGPKKQWVAVEVELNTKATRRTKEILKSYRRKRNRFIGVLYLVPTARDKTRIQNHARKALLHNYKAAIKDNPTEILQQLQALVDKGKRDTQP